MEEHRYFLFYILFLLFCLLAWVFRRSVLNLRTRSYKDLIEAKQRLQGCVQDWRYPDGSYVPQHKRQRMFGELQRLSRKMREHPDNPLNNPNNPVDKE